MSQLLRPSGKAPTPKSEDPFGRRRTETVTFRIESDVWSALQAESWKRRINLNTLVSQILQRYVSWERYAQELKFLPASKHLVRSVFGALDNEIIERIASELGKITAREELLFFFHQVNSQTVLRYIELWTSHFEASQHHDDGKRHFFTIHHDMNQNFSVFSKQYISSMIQNTLAKTVEFETVSPHSLAFNFEA